jgi:hypothetical protein
MTETKEEYRRCKCELKTDIKGIKIYETLNTEEF